MKLIEAVISVTYLDNVKDALRNIGIDNVIIHGMAKKGNIRNNEVFNRGAQCVTGLMTRIKVEIIAADELVARVIDTIAEIARKESHGICRIFIHPLAGAEV
jgi:nitrogen regulatory protein P-II 1